MLGFDRCEGLHQLWGKRLRFQPHCKQAAQVLWNQLLILNYNLNLNLIRSNSSSVNLTPELSRWCLVGRALNPESSFITKRPSSNTLFVISACSLLVKIHVVQLIVADQVMVPIIRTFNSRKDCASKATLILCSARLTLELYEVEQVGIGRGLKLFE